MQAQPTERRRVLPWMTTLLVALFVAVFALEQEIAALVPGLRRTDLLLALGGLNRQMVLDGQAYRLLTAAFLHLNAVHLVFNIPAFAMAGYTLERLAGRAWTFCIFTAGALGGNLMSLVMTEATVSVGASGGIMAMLTAMFLLNFREPNSRRKMHSQWRVLFLVVPALLPAHRPGGMRVDIGTHLGGALVGLVLGLLLAMSWEEKTRLPPFRGAAWGMAGAALLSFVGATYAVAAHFPKVGPMAQVTHAAAAQAACGLFKATLADPMLCR